MKPREGVEVAIPSVRLLDKSVDVGDVFVDEIPVGPTNVDEFDV